MEEKKARITVKLEPSLHYQKATIGIERDITYKDGEDLKKKINAYRKLIHDCSMEAVKQIAESVQDEAKNVY